MRADCNRLRMFFPDHLKQIRRASTVCRDTDGIRRIGVAPEAEQAWIDQIVGMANMGPATAFLSECTPGYYNNEGKSGGGEGFFEGHYPDGAVQFFQMLREWRDEGGLRGLRLTGG